MQNGVRKFEIRKGDIPLADFFGEVSG